jgi:ferritin-like metal-binding protein YciE
MSSSMQELFEDGVKDIYNAEKQLVKALPKMAKKVSSATLRDAMENHLEQTKRQCERLEQVAEKMGFKPTGMVCKGMQGLVEEAEEHMKELDSNACGDAEIIALAQKVEHYEIASYGTLCEWAKLLGEDEALNLLKENLNEEETTDELLTQLAESEINTKALEKGGHEQGSKAGKSSKKSSTSKASMM